MARSRLQLIMADGFIELPSYPYNRDVERRLNKDHLKGETNNLQQFLVQAYMDSEGVLRKLDGHSRAKAWEKGSLEKPTTPLYMTVWEDVTPEEVDEMYDALTSKSQASTASEQAYTAKKRLGFEPKSRLGSSSWKMSFGMIGYKVLEEGMKDYLEELKIIDNWMIDKVRDKKWSAGIRAAVLNTLRDDQNIAQRFWALYRDPESNDIYVNRLRESVEGTIVAGTADSVVLYTAAYGAYQAFKSDGR